MTSAKAKALEGVLERVQGRQASRFQAALAGVGTAVAVYKLLRSGSSDEASDEEAAGDAREQDQGEQDKGERAK